MIEIKKITKKYADYLAVDDLSFNVNSGEVLGFLGPNGAGKSTTMKIISGFLVPDSGSITVNGINVIKDPTLAKKIIGYMPENNPLYKDMLVSDALDFAMELHDIQLSKRKERSDYVVSATGLEKVFYRPISELSKGYKQRVGLALVLVHDPKILILDEPTEGLDPNQRLEIRNLIKDLGKERTVMISTHVMQEVEAMCSRIIIINKGKVVVEGTKEEVLKTKSTKYIIKFKSQSNQILDIFDKNELSLHSEPLLLNHKNSVSEVEFNVIDQTKFLDQLNNTIHSKKIYLYEIVEEKQNLEELFKQLTN